MLERWAVACPTLEVCCLSAFSSFSCCFLIYLDSDSLSPDNHAWRKMDGAWLEVPMDEFTLLSGVPDHGVDFARSPLAVEFLQT
jgi:hypothetical protein